MKSQAKILLAFLLNLVFSVFELVGGIITGSIAIISDSLHDFGDAISIGTSYLLERKSKKGVSKTYSYGYASFSVLGAIITGVVLLAGSLFVIYKGVNRIINPTPINYDGMIIFAIVGVVVNFLATVMTHGGDSLNQRAVSLHMLEDVLGWIAVLVCAVIIKLTGFMLLDAIISIIVAIFVIINAVKILKESLAIFLNKVPTGIDIENLKTCVQEIEDVIDVHHIHVWQIDSEKVLATMHVVCDFQNAISVKESVRRSCLEHGVNHVTIEVEQPNERCLENNCELYKHSSSCHHGHSHCHSHGESVHCHSHKNSCDKE